MYYNFPQNREYMINEKLMVKFNGNIINVVEGKIDILIYGEVKTITLEWMYGISIYGIVLPIEYQDKIFDIEFKSMVTSTVYVLGNIIPIFKTPVYVKDKYRLIAQFPRYAISENSVVYDLLKNKYFKPVKGVPYPRHVLSINNKRVYRATHRLLAITWIHNDDYTIKPIVNHLDGNKWNLTLTNLEWSNYSDNNKHAVEFNLATQQHKFKVLDTTNGIVCIVHSATELSKLIGVRTISYLSQIVLRYAQYVIMDRYIVKSIDNDDDWYDINVLKKRNRELKQSENIIEAKSLVDGTIISNTALDMAKHFNIDQANLRVMARKYIQHSDYGYIFRFKGKTSWDEIVVKDNILKPLSIVAISTDDCMKKLTFKSLRETASYFECDKKTIASKINTNKQYKTYTFKTI